MGVIAVGCLKFDSPLNQICYTLYFIPCRLFSLVKVFHHYSIFFAILLLPQVLYRFLKERSKSLLKSLV